MRPLGYKDQPYPRSTRRTSTKLSSTNSSCAWQAARQATLESTHVLMLEVKLGSKGTSQRLRRHGQVLRWPSSTALRLRLVYVQMKHAKVLLGEGSALPT